MFSGAKRVSFLTFERLSFDVSVLGKVRIGVRERHSKVQAKLN